MKTEPSGTLSPAAAGAVVLVLGLWAHLATGFAPFPSVDDFVYAPLAELRRDPSLYPADTQLRLFQNHALAYDLVYGLAKGTVGVGRGWLVATLVLSVLSVAALAAITGALLRGAPAGARVAAVAVALGLGVLLAEPGIGRGAYGGFVGQGFHHQWVALVLAAGAFGAVLRGRPVAAGALLGLAAVAQPATAAHGALAASLALLAQGRSGVRPFLACAATAMAVGLPALAETVAGLLGKAPSPVPPAVLVEEAYRFRAPHHYAPEPRALGVATLHLLLGAAAGLVLMRGDAVAGRRALGWIGGLAALHLVTVGVYHLRLSDWLPFYLLDATRTSPLAFATAGALAGAALVRAVGEARAGERPGVAALAVMALATAVLALNGRAASFVTVAGGVALLAAGQRWRGAALAGAAAVALIGGAVLARRATVAEVAPEVAAAYAYIRERTPEDALFIVPVAEREFRLRAGRSAYVDFAAFSVAQPAQAWLTRQRLEEVARPDAATRAAAGWPGMEAWEAAQHRAADCAGMAALLRETGATHYLRRTRGPGGEAWPAPVCGEEGPALVFGNGAFALYAAPGGVRAGR